MYFLDKTLDTPAANLALDEALLDWAEATELRRRRLAAMGIADAVRRFGAIVPG